MNELQFTLTPEEIPAAAKLIGRLSLIVGPSEFNGKILSNPNCLDWTHLEAWLLRQEIMGRSIERMLILRMLRQAVADGRNLADVVSAMEQEEEDARRRNEAKRGQAPCHTAPPAP